MLMHCPQINAIIHQTMSYPFIHEDNYELSFPVNEQDHVDQFISSRRVSLSINRDQQFMMAFAWTLPHEKKNFEMFPSVVYVDTTTDTNNEGRPLLSMNGKDTNSRTFTILRVFLPNQQMWTFRWVFCVLLPKIYGNHILSKIKVVITDGDSQETNQMGNAIDQYFPQARRVRCGWHLVNQGWNAYIEGPKLFPKSMQHHYDTVKGISFNWIYSFMNLSHCETLEEYKVSKHLFLKFLGTPSLSEGLGTIFMSNIVTWF